MSTPMPNGPDQQPRPVWWVPPFLRWLYGFAMLALSWALAEAIVLPTPAISSENPQTIHAIHVLIGVIIVLLRIASLWFGIRFGTRLVGLQTHPTRKKMWSPIGSLALAGILTSALIFG